MATSSKINEAIAILLSAYPSAGQKANMGPFLALVTKTLEPYPNEILNELISPRTGIITECAFFPSLAELKLFCDKRHQVACEALYRERQEETRRNALPAPPMDPQVRANINAGFKDLSRELGRPASSQILSVQEERSKAERWLEQQALLVESQPKVLFSESLRARMMGEKRDA
jgi:hypothetical protein